LKDLLRAQKNKELVWKPPKAVKCHEHGALREARLENK